MVNEVLTATDATGKSTFTITGPTDTAGTDVMDDTIVITSITIQDIINGGTIYPLADTSGIMTESGLTLTFGLKYQDVAAAATNSTLTSTATSGTAATTGVTRTYTATQYDQYGGTVASSAGTFSSASALPSGAACTAATPVVCTTLAAHGLAVDDDLIITDLATLTCSTGNGGTALIVNSAGAGATPTTGSTVTVETVPSTTTFTMDIGGSTINGQLATTGATCAAATDADPVVFVATSVASASRTTTTDGTASFSWTDTEGTSGLDTITWNPTTGASKTKAFYRLASSTSSATAGDFTSTNSDATLEQGEVGARLLEWDGTNNDFILEISDGTDVSNTIISYKQYTFDSNDHFATAGSSSSLNGTPATQAAFELKMAASSLAPAQNDIVYVDYGTGVSTNINRFTTD